MNNDTLPDMVFHFRLSEIGLGCGDIPDAGKSAEFSTQLTGTADDIPLEGTGTIRLTGKKQ